MNARWSLLALRLVLLGAGWWAAADADAVLWERAGAAAAALLTLACGWKQPTTSPLGGRDAASLILAAVGLVLGWAWPAAVALAWNVARR